MFRSYTDRAGNRVVEEIRGLSAGTFQHEQDHLDGILFVDRVEDTRTLTTWDGFRRHHEAAYAAEARAIGFPTVYAGVFVRSSYNAFEVFQSGGAH